MIFLDKAKARREEAGTKTPSANFFAGLESLPPELKSVLLAEFEAGRDFRRAVLQARAEGRAEGVASVRGCKGSFQDEDAAAAKLAGMDPDEYSKYARPASASSDAMRYGVTDSALEAYERRNAK